MNYDEYRTEKLPNGDIINYKIKNGIAYHGETSDNVVSALEYARENNSRIRVFYGDTNTGKCWLEEHDVMGKIGRSTGRIKVPLLINNVRSLGGPSLVDHYIIRITMNKRDIYRHPKFYIGEFEMKDSVHDDYPVAVYVDGENVANFEDEKKAERWIKFMKGESNRK